MADERLRELEREATDDPEAAEKLRRERCRVGQCCGCKDLAPSIPGPPPEAYGAMFIIDTAHYLAPHVELIRDRGRVAEMIHLDDGEVQMELRIVGRGSSEASMWLRSIFETHDHNTGIMDSRTLGARLVPAQKTPRVVVPDEPSVVDEPPASMNHGHVYESWPYDEDGA